jgi:hypothetical protein
MWAFEDAPVYEVHMVWHSSTEQDSDQQWMRGLIERLFTRRRQTPEGVFIT